MPAERSWREALIDAFAGVDQAYERRRQVVQAAHDTGMSFRQIGEAVGMSAAGVHKIVGKQGHAPDDSLLDAIAVLRDVDAAVALLPAEERELYERSAQSVVDARRSAIANEGNLYIGGEAHHG